MTNVTSEPLQLRTNTRWALGLVGATLAYNTAEAALSIAAGIIAGSVALVGFGFDSTIEVSAGIVVLVHLLQRSEEDSAWEQRTAQFVGLTFVLLAVYVGYEAVSDLIATHEPDVSYLGIAIATASLVIMPAMSVAKHRLAHRINSRALEAESRETLICSYLSAALLLGLGANALLGWWWADPVAALVIVAVLAREGWEAFTRRELCCID
jgi:divalent metal cation (Fe/Co/Zn/Cd) transporter